MSKSDEKIPIDSVLLLPDGKGINKAYIDIILQEEIPVLCINQNNKKKKLISFKVLCDNNENFWQQSGSWKYFLSSEDFGKIKEKSAVKTGDWELERPKKTAAANKEKKAEKGYGDELEKFAEMSVEDKANHLAFDKSQLDMLLSKTGDDKAVAEALVNSTKDAALINHLVFEEALHVIDEEAKKLTQSIVDNTHEMVKSSVQLMSEEFLNNNLMNTLVEKSNGTIVQHMTRVFLNGVAFLSYFNNLVSTSSAIQKLRISFVDKYRKFYHSLLPGFPADNIILERVFMGGMRAIPPDMLNKWSVGFLIHDIGKASAVEYHEGEATYDRDIVIEHVKLGYKSVMSKTNYPIEASLITGYHHEYYGDPSGYGYFRAYLKQFKKQNPEAKQEYCITYDVNPIMDFKALAYFPAKVLEIIDVYDSVTDPNRVYHDAMTPKEALVMMREEFIEKHHKLDAILFDIFADFISEKQKALK
ncbi:MAG: metal-dependent phosphohydrolase [Treponema sp.]|jgi:hypothetical protein|nr:metal-dependent phosphohydrolase [Treponema sp.]